MRSGRTKQLVRWAVHRMLVFKVGQKRGSGIGTNAVVKQMLPMSIYGALYVETL